MECGRRSEPENPQNCVSYQELRNGSKEAKGRGTSNLEPTSPTNTASSPDLLAWPAHLSTQPDRPPNVLTHSPLQAAIEVASGDPKLQVKIIDLTVEGKPSHS